MDAGLAFKFAVVVLFAVLWCRWLFVWFREADQQQTGDLEYRDELAALEHQARARAVSIPTGDQWA